MDAKMSGWKSEEKQEIYSLSPKIFLIFKEKNYGFTLEKPAEAALIKWSRLTSPVIRQWLHVPRYERYLLITMTSCGIMGKNATPQINHKTASKKPKLKDILRNNDKCSSKASRSQRQEKNESRAGPVLTLLGVNPLSSLASSYPYFHSSSNTMARPWGRVMTRNCSTGQ